MNPEPWPFPTALLRAWTGTPPKPEAPQRGELCRSPSHLPRLQANKTAPSSLRPDPDENEKYEHVRF